MIIVIMSLVQSCRTRDQTRKGGQLKNILIYQDIVQLPDMNSTDCEMAEMFTDSGLDGGEEDDEEDA